MVLSRSSFFSLISQLADSLAHPFIRSFLSPNALYSIITVRTQHAYEAYIYIYLFLWILIIIYRKFMSFYANFSCVCVLNAFAFLACVINPIHKHRISIQFNSNRFRSVLVIKINVRIDVRTEWNVRFLLLLLLLYVNFGALRRNIIITIINANALSRHNCKFCLSVFIMMANNRI